jgi:hypothetical protein
VGARRGSRREQASSVPLLGSVAEVEEVHLCFLGLVAVVVEVAREEGVGQGVVEVGVAAFRRGWPGAPPKIVKSRGMTSLVRLSLVRLLPVVVGIAGDDMRLLVPAAEQGRVGKGGRAEGEERGRRGHGGNRGRRGAGVQAREGSGGLFVSGAVDTKSDMDIIPSI